MTVRTGKEEDLWRCLRCGREFAHGNQAHSCGPLRPIEDHFAGKHPQVREVFDLLPRLVGKNARAVYL